MAHPAVDKYEAFLPEIQSSIYRTRKNIPGEVFGSISRHYHQKIRQASLNPLGARETANRQCVWNKQSQE